MEPILEVKGLKKVFRQRGRNDVTAVDGVSFSLYPGETLGIVGESGSGKSTIAGMIARFMDVTAGEIYLNGQEITHARGAQLREVYRQLQMVFQTPAGSFDPRKTLGDGVGESLRNLGLPKTQIRRTTQELLEKCGLPAELADRYPHQVSGGQCQRAAIARALAIEPRIIICDEATSALDVTVQKQVIGLLESLKAEKQLAYLFICHNLALVQQFCDRVLIMKDGVLVEEGVPDEIIRNPQQEYTRQLLEAVL